jgi:YidC/Oxa1 family membrane protein insertase
VAIINKISNFFLGAVNITAPTGVWEKIIMWFNSGIPNYGWAIIVFTLALKVILLPLDFFNKKITEKNSKVQALIQPEVAKIQKQYANNKQMINQKTMEIYKKYNYNVTGSCLIMLVNMAITLFVFITLFSGLNSMAAYKVGEQYEKMETVYIQNVASTGYDDYLATYNSLYQSTYETAYDIKRDEVMAEKEYADEEELTKEDLLAIELFARTTAGDFVKTPGAIAQMEAAADGKSEETLLSEIHSAVLTEYNAIKDSWLWVSNVWKSDTPWTKSATSFNEFVSMAGIQYKAELAEGEEETFKVRLESNKTSDQKTYENVMAAIESENSVNGYLIIPILAVAATLLSMLASQGKLKFGKKKEINNTPAAMPAGGGWIMVVVLSALMGYITISYNSVFALYILTSSLFGLATTPLINFGIKKLNTWQENKKAQKVSVKQDYKK